LVRNSEGSWKKRDRFKLRGRRPSSSGEREGGSGRETKKKKIARKRGSRLPI